MLTAIILWLAFNALYVFWLAYGRYWFAAALAPAAPVVKRTLFLMTDGGRRELTGSVNQP